MIKTVIKQISVALNARKSYLTSLDRAIGDADHGNNITFGFKAFTDKINSVNDNCQEVVKALGMTLMSKVGGASGVLYGMSFVKGAEAFSKTHNWYNLAEFKSFVSKFTLSLVKIGNAKPTDKTMLDLWWPLNEHLKTTTDIVSGSLIRAVESWEEATLPRRAQRGRASYLGERSVGHKDPGAASSAIILTELIKGITSNE